MIKGKFLFRYFVSCRLNRFSIASLSIAHVLFTYFMRTCEEIFSASEGALSVMSKIGYFLSNNSCYR